MRSGNTYTANGAAEMIKEIVANIKTDDLEIMFRMDSGYFDEEIIETIESTGCKYLIKGKVYPTLAAQVTDTSILFVRGEEGRETTELFTKLNTWNNEAIFQMMMLTYNLFLLFKFDFLSISEYRQQIKTFRLKYVFLAGKIIKTARYVVMKLSEKYPYKDVYEKCLC